MSSNVFGLRTPSTYFCYSAVIALRELLDFVLGDSQNDKDNEWEIINEVRIIACRKAEEEIQ